MAAIRDYGDQAAMMRRQPLAWGMQEWGPLPGSALLYLFWGGPGDGLELHHKGSGSMQRVQHETARGPFQTVKEADTAARAFVRAGLEAGDDAGEQN